MTTSLQVDLGFEVIENCGKADLEDHDYEENGDDMRDGLHHTGPAVILQNKCCEHQYLGPKADTGQGAHPGQVAIKVVQQPAGVGLAGAQVPDVDPIPQH